MVLAFFPSSSSLAGCTLPSNGLTPLAPSHFICNATYMCTQCHIAWVHSVPPSPLPITSSCNVISRNSWDRKCTVESACVRACLCVCVFLWSLPFLLYISSRRLKVLEVHSLYWKKWDWLEKSFFSKTHFCTAFCVSARGYYIVHYYLLLPFFY